MNEFKPDIFFCESTWNGIEKYKDCWRGRIYKNQNILFENRNDLFNILDFCKKSNITTMFWNKEDPIYFNNSKYNFSDTALHFDYIFTTCEECVDKYKRMGHKNVNTLMFGFSEKIFNPTDSAEKKDIAVFAGSWYADLPERCEDLIKIFKMLDDRGIDFQIYDRNYKSSNPLKIYPKDLNKKINPAVSFQKLKNVYKECKFAININTIKNSETMFARRVFELMACNVCVISNDSLGMKKMFNHKVWFIGEDFNFDNIKQICAENAQYVLENHTNKQRLKTICDVLQIKYMKDYKKLMVIYYSDDLEKVKSHFNSIEYHNKNGFIKINNRLAEINNIKNLKEYEQFVDKYKNNYFIIFKSVNTKSMNIKKGLVHFDYIEDDIAISEGNQKFQFKKSKDFCNCLIKSKLLKQIFSRNDLVITKYEI